MNKILATLAASAAFLTAAYAAEIEGVVQTVDPSARIVTLEDGSTFRAPDGVAIETLEAGTKVKVTLDDSNNAVVAVEAM